MQSVVVGNRVAYAIIAGLMCVVCGHGTEARAALSDNLCGAMSAVRTQGFPTSADLREASCRPSPIC